jgi:hypothetical protein
MDLKDQAEPSSSPVPVRRSNLHGVGRDVLPVLVPHHRDPILVAGKLDELPQLLLHRVRKGQNQDKRTTGCGGLQ